MVEEKKSHKRYIRLSKREVDASLAWASDELHIIQLAKLLGKKKWGSTMYSKIARGLRQAFRDGRIKIIN